MLDYFYFKILHKRTVDASHDQSMSISSDRLYHPIGSEATAASSRLIVDIQSDTAITLRQTVTNQKIASLIDQQRLGKDDAVNELSINLGNTCQSTTSDREHLDSASQDSRLLYQNIIELVEISNKLCCSS